MRNNFEVSHLLTEKLKVMILFFFAVDNWLPHGNFHMLCYSLTMCPLSVNHDQQKHLSTMTHFSTSYVLHIAM